MRYLLLASAAAIFSFPAFAQEQKVGREEIVVTGQRFITTDAQVSKSSAPIVETPQAISVVSSDFIDTLDLRTIAEALNYSSGVRSQSTGSDTRIEYYQLRGFSSQNFFKDGMVLYNSGAFLSWTTPVEGVDRLEVLKGPSSVLYGSSAAGGLVNIVSKAPVQQTLARFQVGADEYGSAYGSADVGGAISDTLSFRANALVRRGDTQVELAEDNRTYGSLALGWNPTATTSLTIRGSHTRDRSQRPTGFVPYAGFVTSLADGRRIPIDLFVSDPSQDRYDRDQTEIGYSLETSLTDQIRLVSNARYGEIDLAYAGLYGAFTGNPVLSGGRYYLNRANSAQDASLDNVTADNHLVGQLVTGAVSHEVLAGVDYSRYSTTSAQRTGTAPRLDIFDPQYNVVIPALGAASTTRQRLEQTGLYVQERAKVGPLVAVLSARKDWVDIRATAANNVVTEGSPSRTSYRAGLSYVTDIGVAPYVSYATSFTPVIGLEAATGRYYRPETGKSWEGGVKYQPEWLPLLATASLFNIDRDGILVSNPVAGFPSNQSQLGLVRSRGGEVELQAQPLPTLKLTAALTAFDIENREGAAATLGKAPTATPEFVASAFADYTFPEGGLVPGFGFGAGVRHVGKSYADTANTLVVPAATVFDSTVHYDVDRFRIAANVSNLFNKRYVGACPSAGTCYAANLRRATISLTWSLGE
jgi:iron complex outermembrane receptor protein